MSGDLFQIMYNFGKSAGVVSVSPPHVSFLRAAFGGRGAENGTYAYIILPFWNFGKGF